MDMPTSIALGTLCFHRAGIAGGRICAILHLLCSLKAVCRIQHLSLRAVILVMDGIIPELSQSIVARALSFLGYGNVGPQMGILDGFDVLDRSIRSIASDLFEPETPAQEHMPEEIKHGLMVHYLAWHDQHRQDDAMFTSIDDVVRMIAQMGSSPRCQRIGV